MNSWVESQFSLNGKKALITGASKGIGASIAIAFANAGAEIVLVGRSESSLESTKNEVARLGNVPKMLICDVESRAQISEAFKNIDELNVDIVVNNAGTQ